MREGYRVIEQDSAQPLAVAGAIAVQPITSNSYQETTNIQRARVAIRGPFCHWAAPQWVPPPSKPLLVSNCQPANISGPVEPWVGATVSPFPSSV